MQAHDGVASKRIPVVRRTTWVLTHLLALILIPFGGFALGFFVREAFNLPSAPVWGALAALAAVVISFVWGFRLWVEVGPETLVFSGFFRRQTHRIEDLQVLSVKPYAGSDRLTPKTPIMVSAHFAGDRRIWLWMTPIDEAWVVLDPLIAVLLRRLDGALARGESADFVDRPVFPWKSVMGVAVVVVMVATETGRSLAPLLLMGKMGWLVPIAFVWIAAIELRRWWWARQTCGLSVSAEGIRPLANASLAERASKQSAAYRGAVGEAAGWLPWASVTSAEAHGAGIELRAQGFDHPIMLTPRTDNLWLLRALLQRRGVLRPVGAPMANEHLKH